MNNSIIQFKKEKNSCNVIKYQSDLNLDHIVKLNDIIFDNFSTLSKLLQKDKVYKQIGNLEKKRVRIYAVKTKTIMNI